MTAAGGVDNGIRLRIGWQRDGFVLDVGLDLALRGITGIFGPSGAGKSTLLRCLAGLEQPDSARFRVDDRVLDDSENGVRAAVHERRIGYVFQEARLFGHLDVSGNLDYSLRRRGDDGGPGRDEIVELLHLGPLLGRRTATLSGGEAQRVAIGRALLSAPKLLLMDEPVSALDVERRNDVLPFVERVHAEFDVPILYVSHNIDEIALLCDQLVVMQDGRVVADGALSNVLQRTELPVLGGAEASAVVRATVDEYDARYDITRVRIEGGTLWLPGQHSEAHAGLRVRIRASDVSLAADRVPATSILNVLEASVEAVEHESTHSLLVHLDAGGTRIMSRITRKSADRLGIERGVRLFAQIKAISVRPASL